MNYTAECLKTRSKTTSPPIAEGATGYTQQCLEAKGKAGDQPLASLTNLPGGRLIQILRNAHQRAEAYPEKTADQQKLARLIEVLGLCPENAAEIIQNNGAFLRRLLV